MTEKIFAISKEILAVDKNEIISRKLPQYIAGVSATFGALAAGLVYGWTSPAGDDGANLDYPFEMDPNIFSWTSSIFNIGAATICIPIGILTNVIGRRRSMLILTVPFTIGWACVIWPNSSTMLISGRFILGMSGGAFCVTAPMYTAEISDNDTRGRLGSYFELFLCTGILLSYILGLMRNMYIQSLISAAVPLLFFSVFFFMPETPTYCLMKGDVKTARKTLLWLRGPNYDVDAELDDQKKALDEAERDKVSFFVAIRSRAAVKGLFVGFGLMFFQSFSGIDVIIFYAGSIFRDATGDNSDWSTIVIGVMQVTSVFLYTFFIDRWGRRVLLMISGTAMALATFVLGMYFYLDKFSDSMNDFRWLPLVCISSFNIFIAFGFNPIPWVIIGEIFSPQIKGVAASSACFFNWLVSFVVTKFYSQVKRDIGNYGAFWIFSGVCGLSVVFVFFVVPETKCKSLQQIQIELAGGVEKGFKKGSDCKEEKRSKIEA